jgi:hypothetical protein
MVKHNRLQPTLQGGWSTESGWYSALCGTDRACLWSALAAASAISSAVKEQSARYHSKEQMIGVEMSGKFKAYPFVGLSKGPIQVDDTAGGRKITVRSDHEHRTGTVYDATGKEIPSVIAF